MADPVSPAYVNMINGFRSDCQNLIEVFKEKFSDDFREFIPIWKALKFHLIYEKYADNGSSCEFKENSLQIAKTIMLNEHFVGGMFLLYGLYFLQEEPKGSIRLEYDEYEKLLKLLKEERRTLLETCQPGFMFAKLMKNNAFAFVRFSREYSIEGQNRARLVYNDQQNVLQQEDKKINVKEWLDGFVKRTDIIDEIKQVENEYFEKKQQLKEEHPELNLSLDMAPCGIIDDIQKVVTQLQFPEPETMSIGQRRTHLKKMKRTIKWRYGVPKAISSGSGLTKKGEPFKKRGPPKGKRKKYLNVEVNNPETSESNTPESSELSLSLPVI